jgi:membrane protein DedA with SNARE-associated domain
LNADGLALAGLVLVLFVKEAGVPIPVPGDLLVIGAGIAAAGLGAAAPIELVAILLAGYAGGSVQFFVVRGALRERFLRALARLGIPPARLETLAAWLRRRGAPGVAVARATPGVRIGAIAASGIAGLPFRAAFLPGLVVGNGLFVGGHFALGYIAGPPALALLSSAGPVALAGGAVLVLLAAVGALGWRLVRRRAAGPGGAPADTAPLAVLPGYGSWAEAACPACLALTLVAGRSDRAA